jgi:hypothetical protein
MRRWPHGYSLRRQGQHEGAPENIEHGKHQQGQHAAHAQHLVVPQHGRIEASRAP